MSFGHVVAIVNPKSQNGALGRQWSFLARTLRQEMGAFEHRLTRGPGDATALAREALREGADLVIAVGGDGTTHEVVNGFFADDGSPVRARAALGILPFGTGGDFRRTLGVPHDVSEAARILKQGQRRLIDVGRIEFSEGGRHGNRAALYFVNIASFGLGGLVDRIVNRSSKALGGKASFFLGTMRALMQYHNKLVRVVFDGDENDFIETRISNVAVANGQYFGGGMHIAPAAEVDDGKFDVVVLGDLSRREVVFSSRRVYAGTHVSLEKVTVRRATSVTAVAVDPDDEVLLDVDGEAPGALPATFTLRSRVLPVIVPGAA